MVQSTSHAHDSSRGTTEPSRFRHESADEVAAEVERSLWMRRTSWGAILAGAVSAIGLQALLTVLGAAIGVTAYGGAGDSAEGVSMFAGIWWLITGTVSLLIGGVVVGRMITIPRNPELVVHGFTMWGLTAIFGFMFLWSSAGMVGSVGAQSIDRNAPMESVNEALGTDVVVQSGGDGQGDVEAGGETVTAAEAQDAATAAAWWTLVALLLGVGAAIGGTYVGAAPLGPKSDDRRR